MVIVTPEIVNPIPAGSAAAGVEVSASVPAAEFKHTYDQPQQHRSRAARGSGDDAGRAVDREHETRENRWSSIQALPDQGMAAGRKWGHLQQAPRRAHLPRRNEDAGKGAA